MPRATHRRGYVITIAVLAAIIVVLVWKFGVSGSTQPSPDGRTAVVLDPAERAFVLHEMRGFVAGLRDIDAALARGDAPAAAQASRRLGASAAHDAPVALLGKLPLRFKQLAFETHRGFDELAAQAERGAPLTGILAGRAAVLDRCVACHAEFAFEQGGAR